MHPDSPTALTLPIRPRRLRQAPWVRTLVAETVLRPADLIWPLFVIEGQGQREPVAALPGIERLSPDQVVLAAREALALGIPAIALFPVVDPARKTPDGREAQNPENLVCRTVRLLKAQVPQMGVIADVALDPYTTHGHDGILDARGAVDNDATVAALTHQALSLAQAGCDVVAPSDMMDGRIGVIRLALEHAGYRDVMILSYAAKYASALYGPFREALGSAHALGGADKRGYQMDPANAREAVFEAQLDVQEGADMLMVKPATFYLDVIARLRAQTPLPLCAYHVSGEYAMLKAAAERGWIDGEAAMLEALLSIKRAGADAIVTYAAAEIAQRLTS